MLRTRSRIGPYPPTWSILAGFPLLLAAYGALAATPPSRAALRAATNLSPDFDRAWAKLVAAAKQEGHLVFNGGSSWQQVNGLGKVAQAFHAKFGIKVTTGRGGGRAQAERMLAERRAGVSSVDIVSSGRATFQNQLLPGGALQPIKLLLFHPDVVNESLWKGGVHRYLDSEQRYVKISAARNAPSGISINTKLVKTGEIKSFWDLLNQKWKGKVVAYHPRTAQASIGDLYFDKDLGPEFLRRIYSWDGIRFVTTNREFADGLGSGAYAIGFLDSPAQRDIRELAALGAPVKLLFAQDLANVRAIASPGGAGMIGVARNPPNPNAQELFVNWFLTREAQLLFNRSGPGGYGEYESLRADVPNDSVLPELRLPEKFVIREADPDSTEQDRIAEEFRQKLMVELGL